MALPVRKASNVPLQMSGLNRGRGLAQRWVGEGVDIAPVSVAILMQGVEQLVAGDREQPGTKRRTLTPRVPLEMHGEQSFLCNCLTLNGRQPYPP